MEYSKDSKAIWEKELEGAITLFLVEIQPPLRLLLLQGSVKVDNSIILLYTTY